MPDMTRRTPVLILLVAFALPTLAETDLTGLWSAKNRFGPDAHGTAIIQRSGNTYTADMIGLTLPVTMTSGEFSFALPDHEGTFRGRLDQRGAIVGHWFRGPSRLNYGPRDVPVIESPVTFEPDGANRWRATIDPPADSFAWHLLLQKRADGSLGALLRNPERDQGMLMGVDHLVVDGKNVKLIGKRRGAEEDVATGTYDAENDVLTLYFASRGGSYDFQRDTNENSPFYPRGKNPGRYVYRAPISVGDGWNTGTLDDAGIDRPAMEKLIQSIVDMPMDSPDAPMQHGLLIARHGKLVLEEYFHGMNRDQLHTTRSASKVLSGIVAGAAMQAGVPLELSSPVYKVMNGGTFPADLEAQKKAMTLEDLLTMSAGFFCDDTNDAAPGNEEVMSEQTEEPDFYRYIMKVPMATPPGENSVYCSAIANLALGMTGSAAHEDPVTLFDRLVGGPMKIRHYAWGLDRAWNPYGGGSVMLTLRDFAKLGQLMLSGGTWDGKRILSREFVARATSRLYHLRGIYYGYYWWNEDLPYKNRMVEAYQARGAGGQTVTVVPELDLVVATFAGSFASRKPMFAASTDVTPRSVLPAVREPGDDPHAPVVERVWVDPYGPSKDGSRVKR